MRSLLTLINDAENCNGIDPQESQQTLEITKANLGKAKEKRDTTDVIPLNYNGRITIMLSFTMIIYCYFTS